MKINLLCAFISRETGFKMSPLPDCVSRIFTASTFIPQMREWKTSIMHTDPHPSLRGKYESFGYYALGLQRSVELHLGARP